MDSRISTGLASALQSAGLSWAPRRHDAFMIPDRGLDHRAFVVSDLTIDVEQVAGHATITFNGAVEWSLDYILSQDVIWLPSETQLREMLGAHLVGLRRVEGGYRCEIAVDGEPAVFESANACDAYGEALLHVMRIRRG